MSTSDLLPDLHLPRKQPPSQRDRNIYIAIRVDGRTQEEVAREFGISQPRVAQIVQHVAEWIDAALTNDGSCSVSGQEPASQAEPRTVLGTSLFEGEVAGEDAASWTAAVLQLNPSERLRLAEHIVSERLEHVYREAMNAWRKSGLDAEERRTRRAGADTVEERIVKTQSGKCAFLNQAMRAALASARLMGVDVSGREMRKAAQAELQAQRQAQEAEKVRAAAPSTETVNEKRSEQAAARTTYYSEIRPENMPVSSQAGVACDGSELGLSEQERLELFEAALRSAA